VWGWLPLWLRQENSLINLVADRVSVSFRCFAFNVGKLNELEGTGVDG
jgi:hypothetical protein